ncbi:MAG: cation transporter [Flavobacteriales bacterium]|nr:cation transporter [Flavobacteriales bacterium]
MSSTSIKVIRQATWIGSIANILLGIMKVGIGMMTGSQALIADGVHSFSDLITDAAILIGSKFWTAPPDKEHPYGHGRFETLTNIFIGVLLAIVAIGIGWEAIHSISTNSDNHASIGIMALIAATISIVAKELLYRWTLHKAKAIRSRALHANAWHHRSDALSSLPVVVSVVVKFFYPHVMYLDQIAACIVMVMIFKAAWEILWPAILELTDINADEALEEKIQGYAKLESHIREVHEIRSRRTGSTILIDLHLLVAPEMCVRQAHDISERFKAHIMDTIEDVIDVIIHIEPDVIEERRVPWRVDTK